MEFWNSLHPNLEDYTWKLCEVLDFYNNDKVTKETMLIFEVFWKGHFSKMTLLYEYCPEIVTYKILSCYGVTQKGYQFKSLSLPESESSCSSR